MEVEVFLKGSILLNLCLDPNYACSPVTLYDNKISSYSICCVVNPCSPLQCNVDR
jgi:hypothetical protein